jgi:hypothetical protein
MWIAFRKEPAVLTHYNVLYWKKVARSLSSLQIGALPAQPCAFVHFPCTSRVCAGSRTGAATSEWRLARGGRQLKEAAKLPLQAIQLTFPRSSLTFSPICGGRGQANRATLTSNKRYSCSCFVLVWPELCVFANPVPTDVRGCVLLRSLEEWVVDHGTLDKITRTSATPRRPCHLFLT